MGATSDTFPNLIAEEEGRGADRVQQRDGEPGTHSLLYRGFVRSNNCSRDENSSRK